MSAEVSQKSVLGVQDSPTEEILSQRLHMLSNLIATGTQRLEHPIDEDLPVSLDVTRRQMQELEGLVRGMDLARRLILGEVSEHDPEFQQFHPHR